MKKSTSILIVTLMLVSNAICATEVKISSLKELAHYASQSGNVITMQAGIYPLIDFLTIDSMAVRHDRKEFQLITFSGSNNIFKLEGVEIIVDNALRKALRPKIHSSEFLVKGSNNTFNGLTIRYEGEGTSPGGAALEVGGKGNVLRKIMLHVKGSFPYGYGDYLGKGPIKVINHEKHSGLLITGFDTKLYACKVYMRSLGHAFFIQGGDNTYFEDCYAEGELRSTNEMLAEISGPAFESNFESVYTSYKGDKKIQPDYMKSLNECGFRTYSTGTVTAINCVAKNMRVGFALAKVSLTNCEAIDCERGYYLNKAIAKNCRGDAKYGPLIYLVGDETSQIDLTLMPGESKMKVHAVATICGTGHEISIKSNDKSKREKAIPIMLGYGMPDSGENASPIPEKTAENIKINNMTSLPIIVGKMAKNAIITTNGVVNSNQGTNIKIIKK